MPSGRPRPPQSRTAGRSSRWSSRTSSCGRRPRRWRSSRGCLSKNPRDLQIRKLLAQALVANGQTSEAVQELEEAYAGAPDDVELAFTLALGYLRLKKVDLAERLFAKILQARPIPQTHVLIGRTYRDFGEYERATGRAASGPRDGPPRAPGPLPPRDADAGAAGERSGGSDRRVPGRAEAGAGGPGRESRAGNGPGRCAASRGGPARSGAGGPFGAPAGAHPLLPRAMSEGARPDGGGRAHPGAGAGAGAAAGGGRSPAPAHPQPARHGAAGPRSRGRGRPSFRGGQAPLGPRVGRRRGSSWTGT